MSFDGITAGLLLQTASNGASHDDVYKLYKDLQGNKDAPTPEVIELVTSWIGRECKVKYTSHKGIIVGPNTSDCGFYPGGRFPVYVKITASELDKAVGQTFEYGLDQIVFDEKNKLITCKKCDDFYKDNVCPSCGHKLISGLENDELTSLPEGIDLNRNPSLDIPSQNIKITEIQK